MRQLDIFADSVPVQLANNLIDALVNLDRAASRRFMSRLTEADPDHAGLPRFEILCDFVDHLTDSYDCPDKPHAAAIAADQRLIWEHIIPASSVMGSSGGEMISRCWSILARASEAAGIGHECDDCFAAELYLRARQFHDAVRTALTIPGSDMRAAAQRWLGLGYYGCGETEKARTAVLRYAWLAPERFEALVEEMNDAKLTRDWSSFQDDLDDLDAAWFPAWCAHEKKAGSSIQENLPDCDGCSAYLLVTGLAMRERGGIGNALLADRARLKRLNESFFAFYMKHRSRISG